MLVHLKFKKEEKEHDFEIEKWQSRKGSQSKVTDHHWIAGAQICLRSLMGSCDIHIRSISPKGSIYAPTPIPSANHCTSRSVPAS